MYKLAEWNDQTSTTPPPSWGQIKKGNSNKAIMSKHTNLSNYYSQENGVFKLVHRVACQ